MKRETMLTLAVIALLVLNFGTLGYLFFQRPPHPPGGGQRPLDRRIVQELQLTDDQKQQFETLKKGHHEQMLALEKSYRATMENYFNLLKNDNIDPRLSDSLQAALGAVQEERAKITLRHFKSLKGLCTPEQQQHFDALIPELLEVILPRKPFPPPAGRE